MGEPSASAGAEPGKEFYDAAIQICAGEFEVPALEVELEARERKAKRCEIKIDELQNLQSKSWGDEEKSEQLKAKLEDVKRKKSECDIQHATLKKQISAVKDDVRNARHKIHNIINKKKKDQSDYEAIVRVKKEVMRLASEVNPQGTLCAEKLGQLFIRTPEFIVQVGIVDDAGAAKNRSTLGDLTNDGDQVDSLRRLPDEADSQDMFSGDTWEIFETIDNLAQQAEAQSATSIVTLMGMLGAEERFPQVTQHLIRTVLDKAELVQRKDQMAIRSGESCAVTVHWPDPGRGSVNASAYKDLLAWAKKEYDEVVRVHTRENSMDERPGKRGSLDDSINSRISQQLPDVQPVISREDCLEQSKQKINRDFFKEMGQEEGLLHCTPLVCEVLLKLAQRGWNVIMMEHTVLYGHIRGGVSDKSKEEHWFFRRKAAARICELAMLGSEKAQKMIVEELLKDEHWMIKALVVSEACQVLGSMDASKDLHDDMAKAVVGFVYSPAPALQSRRPENPVDAEARTNIQKAAETALVKEMRRYNDTVYKKMYDELLHESESKPEHNKPIFKRVVDAIGHTKEIRSAGQGNKKDMAKKMREYQASLQHQEDAAAQRRMGP